MTAAAGQGNAAAAAAPATMHSAAAGETVVDVRSSAPAEALLRAQSVTAAAASADAQLLSAFTHTDSPATASRTATAAPVPADSKAAHNARDLFAATAPLQLRIDRLVIDGLPRMAGGERALRAALLQELQQLLTAQPPALTQGGAIARLPTLELALPADGDAASVGRALARALHRSLGA